MTRILIAALAAGFLGGHAFAAPTATSKLGAEELPLEAGKFCCTSATKSGGKGCFEKTDGGKCPNTHYTISCTGDTTLSPEGRSGSGTLTCNKPSSGQTLVSPTERLQKLIAR